MTVTLDDLCTALHLDYPDRDKTPARDATSTSWSKSGVRFAYSQPVSTVSAELAPRSDSDMPSPHVLCRRGVTDGAVAMAWHRGYLHLLVVIRILYLTSAIQSLYNERLQLSQYAHLLAPLVRRGVLA